jgi:hypothetical protein
MAAGFPVGVDERLLLIPADLVPGVLDEHPDFADPFLRQARPPLAPQ